jgi:hypothetical protein
LSMSSWDWQARKTKAAARIITRRRMFMVSTRY